MTGIHWTFQHRSYLQRGFRTAPVRAKNSSVRPRTKDFVLALFTRSRQRVRTWAVRGGTRRSTRAGDARIIPPHDRGRPWQRARSTYGPSTGGMPATCCALWSNPPACCARGTSLRARSSTTRSGATTTTPCTCAGRPRATRCAPTTWTWAAPSRCSSDGPALDPGASAPPTSPATRSTWRTCTRSSTVSRFGARPPIRPTCGSGASATRTPDRGTAASARAPSTPALTFATFGDVMRDMGWTRPVRGVPGLVEYHEHPDGVDLDVSFGDGEFVYGYTR